MLAVITHRRLQEDLADRRLKTAQLRTVCTFIATTLQLAEGAENTMLTEAQNLSLGTGTEPPGTPTPGAAAPAAGGPGGFVLAPEHERADDPPSVLAGQWSPVPDGGNRVPLSKVNGLLGDGAQL